ncbi:MAG: hypothetical protein P8170_23305, partial [Gemmatimonadota bacterium]
MVELHQIVSLVQETLHQSEDLSVSPVGQDVQELQVALVFHQAQDTTHGLGIHIAAGEGDHLVQEGQRVPHAPIGLPGHDSEGFFGRRLPFPFQHDLEASHDVAHADPSEVEALTARQNGRGRLLDLLGLRGGEYEDDPRRRLLQDLQQRVPRFPGEHVGLVHDVDLETAFLRGRVHGPLPQIPCVIHAAVGRRVDLHHVQSGVATPDPGATRALSAGFAFVTPVGAVEGHGQHPSQRGLAHPPGTAEEVGVSHATQGDRPSERLRYVLLDGYVGEAPGAVFSCQGGVGQGSASLGNLCRGRA